MTASKCYLREFDRALQALNGSTAKPKALHGQTVRQRQGGKALSNVCPAVACFISFRFSTKTAESMKTGGTRPLADPRSSRYGAHRRPF